MSFGAIPGMEEALGRCGPCCASDVGVLGGWAPSSEVSVVRITPHFLYAIGWPFITRPTRSLGHLRL